MQTWDVYFLAHRLGITGAWCDAPTFGQAVLDIIRPSDQGGSFEGEEEASRTESKEIPEYSFSKSFWHLSSTQLDSFLFIIFGDVHKI